MITAILTWRGHKYPVNYLGSRKYGPNDEVTLFEVEVTNGYEPFTRQTHGGPANYATGVVSRRCLSNIKVDDIPVQIYLWKRNARRAETTHQSRMSTPVSAGVS